MVYVLIHHMVFRLYLYILNSVLYFSSSTPVLTCSIDVVFILSMDMSSTVIWFLSLLSYNVREMVPRGPFYWMTLIPSWINNYIHYKVWDEITYPFPNLIGATVEVWEWISNFTPHFTGHVITYPSWGPRSWWIVGSRFDYSTPDYQTVW